MVGSCVVSQSCKYTVAVQGTTSDKSMKAWEVSVVDRHTPMATPTNKAMDTFFLRHVVNQVNDFSNSLHYKQFLQWYSQGGNVKYL